MHILGECARRRLALRHPTTEAVKLYGGTERVISWLIDDLLALGHEVVCLQTAIRNHDREDP
jgi:hypothetical protein